MKMLAKVICKGCGKEFEQRSGVGKPRIYCSKQCREAQRNRRFRDSQNKKLGMDYWAWKWRNDPVFREKKREYDRKYNRSLAERRRDNGKED